MRIRLGTVRRMLREALVTEQAWVPGRWFPSEGEPLSPKEAERLGQPLGMEETDDRMVGDDSGPGEEGNEDISDHLRGDEEKTSLGNPPDETIREHGMLHRELKRFFLQEDPAAAGLVDPRGAKGAYTPFDMAKDHMGTDDLSANWYKSPGRPVGTNGDPYRGEDPHSQLGFHAPKGSTPPPAVDGEEGVDARRAPPIWQLSAGSDTNKVLGADAHPGSNGEESGDETEEDEDGTPETGPTGDKGEQGSSSSSSSSSSKGKKQDDGGPDGRRD